MPKKLTIEEVREKALLKYSITLLSKEYTDSMSKMEWKDNKTGIKFHRRWNDICNGKTTPGDFPVRKKLSIEEVKKEALEKHDLTLLSTEYKNNHTIMQWMDNKTGIKFFRRWNSIKSGQTTTKNKNDYKSDKNRIESYKQLGYQYNQTEEQYLSSEVNGTNKLFIIEHPLLPEPWITTMSAFIRSAETHLNQSGMSYGEQVIYSILKNNDIEFYYQYRVSIHSSIHKFDFYLPGYNLYIEYDGEQHFSSIKSWGGEKALENRINRDNEKDKYVSSIGANIIRIPYTLNNRKDILSALSDLIDKDIVLGDLYICHKKREVAEYYDTHNIKQTINKYHIGKTTISRYYKQVYGMSKSERKVVS